MSLKVDLQALEERVRKNVGQDVMDVFENMIQSLTAVPRLLAGSQTPYFTLPNAFGENVSLQQLLVKGPVVLQFYRGQWCPFCNLQLRALQQVVQSFNGVQLVAISPQTPDFTEVTVQKNELTFDVLSDVGGRVAEQYNVRFAIPKDVQSLYETWNSPIASYNGGENVLTIPATFVIDQTGTIRYTYVQPNFMQRLEPAELVQVLEELFIAVK